MGAFEGLAKIVGEAAKPLSEAVKPIATDIGREAKEWGETIRPFTETQQKYFSKTPQGQLTSKLLLEFRRNTDRVLEQLTQKASPAVSKTQNNFSETLHGEARATARTMTFGSNDAALTTLAQSVHQQHGYIEGQNFIDHVAMFLHEDEKIDNIEHASRFKLNAQKRIEANDPAYKNYENLKKQTTKLAKKEGMTFTQAAHVTGLAKTERPYTYKIDAVYSKPSDKERQATSFIYSRLSPLIAIPHIGTALNTVWATDAAPLAKAITDVIGKGSVKDFKAQWASSGIFAKTSLDCFRVIEESRSGLVTRYLPGGVQDIFAKITSTPGFNYVRDWQLAFQGSAIYHSVNDFAAALKENPNDQRAINWLRKYNLNNDDLAMIAKTGEVSRDQMERAMWFGTNRNIFLDTSMNRAYMSQANVWMRTFNMYHGYVSSQAKFIAEQVKTDWAKDTRTPLTMAKSLAMLGVIMPAAGEALKILEMVGRGQFSQISQEAKNDYETLTLQKQESDAAKARDLFLIWADAMSHLGAFGVMYGIVQGVHRNLYKQMAGALWGTVIDTAQDIERPIASIAESKQPNLAPLGRDAVKNLLPYGIGRYLSHAIPGLQTRREQQIARKKNKLKGLSGMKGFKKLKGDF